jgi:Glyoxalase-like domain
MELDHIFVFTAQPEIDVQKLKTLGISETYRRDHIGQGTRNACFAFENAFLELLWITDQEQAGSPLIARSGLLERSQWQTRRTCPFGIAWRGGALIQPVWAFTPPYLPSGLSVQVASDSDDTAQPMMFTFPSSSPPFQWDAVRHKNFQNAGGFTTIQSLALTLPVDVKASQALLQIAQSMSPELKIAQGDAYSLRVRLGRRSGKALVLSFPEILSP